jgi:hypothetical protein
MLYNVFFMLMDEPGTVSVLPSVAVTCHDPKHNDEQKQGTQYSQPGGFAIYRVKRCAVGGLEESV